MSKACRILVVDDEVDVEPLVLQRMRREVRKGVYEFRFAHNGVEALEVLNEDESIDLVLSDINMPEMDGLDLLDQIPSVNPNIKSVIISAYGDMKNIRTAMNRGAFDFVTKPIDFDDLRITIDRTRKHLEMWREALKARDRLVSLQNELGLAGDMQQSILPREFPHSDNFEIFSAMVPARDVGGDFYDVIRLNESELGLAVADVSDKGVAAAMFMMSSRSLLKGAAVGAIEPPDVLREVNDLLAVENETAMFVTICYAIYDHRAGILKYTNGGHNAPLLVRSDGTAEYLDMPPGFALGVVPGAEFHGQSIDLERNDLVLVYSDGVTEAANNSEEMFGEERLKELGSQHAGSGAESFCTAVLEAVHAFTGDAPQTDDITVMALKRTQ